MVAITSNIPATLATAAKLVTNLARLATSAASISTTTSTAADTNSEQATQHLIFKSDEVEWPRQRINWAEEAFCKHSIYPH